MLKKIFVMITNDFIMFWKEFSFVVWFYWGMFYITFPVLKSTGYLLCTNFQLIMLTAFSMLFSLMLCFVVWCLLELMFFAVKALVRKLIA